MYGIKDKVRKLRREQTESEKKFWDIVRTKRFLGLKFIRQYPIKYTYNGSRGLFIADFYCDKKKLILELDGKVHEKQKEYDEFRNEMIKILGYNLIRLKNEELNNIEELKIKLEEFIKST